MWKAMGNVWKVWRGVWLYYKLPATPVPLPNKFTVIAHKDDNSVVGFFILLEYMIAFIQ